MTPVVRIWLRRRCPTVSEEFQTPQGIADLVGCDWRLKQVRQRLETVGACSFRSRLSAAVWQALSAEDALSETSLARQFEGVATAHQLRQELQWLGRRHLAEQLDEQRWRRLDAWRPFH